jgi:hypothetical protein
MNEIIPDRRFDTLQDIAPVVRCHEANLKELARRLRLVEKALDTRATPLWKRILFRLDGWPSWAIVAERPTWRPWRRWYRS